MSKYIYDQDELYTIEQALRANFPEDFKVNEGTIADLTLILLKELRLLRDTIKDTHEKKNQEDQEIQK